CSSAVGTSRDSRSGPTTAWSRIRDFSLMPVCSCGTPERPEHAVNALDFVVLVVGAGAAVGGWRLGFAARVLAWAGVAVGLAIGVHFVPRIVTEFGGARAENRASIAVLFLLLVATLGQTLGLVLSALV